MTDKQALEQIWAILDILNPDEQWSPDTLDNIADVMMQWKTGTTNVLAAMRALDGMDDTQ